MRHRQADRHPVVPVHPVERVVAAEDELVHGPQPRPGSIPAWLDNIRYALA